MIRKSTININYSNKNKLQTLDIIIEESKRVVNLFIDELWKQQEFTKKYIDFKVETWLSARMQKNLGKQALEIVKSQRKRKKKTKPIFNKYSFSLDSTIVKNIYFDINSFDVWVKLFSIGNKIKLHLPGRKHRHFNKLNASWEMKRVIRLRKVKDKYFIDLLFEKPKLPKKSNGKTIGIDIGYKKLIATSEKEILGSDMKLIYEKISHKKPGSKAFKRSLIERDNKTNQVVNQLNTSNIKTIIVEDLKNVKKNTKDKISKKFSNKLQRWIYPKVLNKLSRLCEEQGIEFIKVNPAYTSQTCSQCGIIDKNNRKGEIYQCSCGLTMDADINAAINIHNRGVFSLSAAKI